MSTRATYRIAGGFDNRQATPTFYIHHDGYFAGAAAYFNAMLHKLPSSKGGMAEAFLRANDGAELTGLHTSHGDTEYQYDLAADGGLLARDARKVREGASGVLYVGNVWSFVNANHSLIDEFEAWVEVERNRWMTRSQAQAAVDRRRLQLESYRERFPQYVGNIDSLARELAAGEAWLNAFAAV